MTDGLHSPKRPFCAGTQDIHKELEKKIAKFHGMEDAILFPSCFDANAGIFEAILSKDDAGEIMLRLLLLPLRLQGYPFHPSVQCCFRSSFLRYGTHITYSMLFLFRRSHL